jgi:hypothetical protein
MIDPGPAIGSKKWRTKLAKTGNNLMVSVVLLRTTTFVYHRTYKIYKDPSPPH